MFRKIVNHVILSLIAILSGLNAQPAIHFQYVLNDSTFVQKRSFLRKVFDWIAGEEKLHLVKPYDAIFLNSKTGWILDQGTGLIYSIVNGELKPVKMDQLSVQTLPSPVDMVEGPENNLFITDSYLNTVFILDKQNNELKKFIADKQFKRITGIAWSNKLKRIYIVDTGNHCVYIYSEKGDFLSRFGRRGKEPGQFNFPTFLEIDNQGNIYIVDSMNFRVQVFSADGKYMYHFGEAGDKPGFFGRPKQIALDSAGNLYIVDVYFHAVQVFNREGDWLTTFGGFGEGTGHFWLPGGIYINPEQDIVICDTYNRRIQVFKVLNGGTKK